MGIKRKIKIRKVTGIGVHGLATGDPLDLSDNARASDELPASDGESTRRSVSTDDNVFKDKTISNDYKSGGAYKAILGMFAEQLDDEKFAAHCRKFFKGENEKD